MNAHARRRVGARRARQAGASGAGRRAGMQRLPDGGSLAGKLSCDASSTSSAARSAGRTVWVAGADVGSGSAECAARRRGVGSCARSYNFPRQPRNRARRITPPGRRDRRARRVGEAANARRPRRRCTETSGRASARGAQYSVGGRRRRRNRPVRAERRACALSACLPADDNAAGGTSPRQQQPVRAARRGVSRRATHTQHPRRRTPPPSRAPGATRAPRRPRRRASARSESATEPRRPDPRSSRSGRRSGCRVGGRQCARLTLGARARRFTSRPRRSTPMRRSAVRGVERNDPPNGRSPAWRTCEAPAPQPPPIPSPARASRAPPNAPCRTLPTAGSVLIRSCQTNGPDVGRRAAARTGVRGADTACTTPHRRVIVGEWRRGRETSVARTPHVAPARRL